ncbi:GAF domain-containing protein [Nocardia sp. 004]|uniref:GAF domain-containing protein n=1 Tax=Nocardia sp. 004 TaxID=3385978 RepID=UPI00399F2910
MQPGSGQEPVRRTSASEELNHYGQIGRPDSRRGWTVVETLAGPDRASIVLDGVEPRVFSPLAYTNAAPDRVVARFLAPLVQECAESGRTRDKCVTLPDKRVMRLVAVPVLGPSCGVYGVAIWVGSITGQLPPVPVIGTIEWQASGAVTASPAAQYLLRPRHGDFPRGYMVQEIPAHLDCWDDRAAFLAVFDPQEPTAHWAGTATKNYEDGSRRQLHIAVRSDGSTDPDRTTRAIVCEVTKSRVPVDSGLHSLNEPRRPISSDHALALVDLKTGFVREWLTVERTPLAGWRHHNPELDEESRLLVAVTCVELDTGGRESADLRVRVRCSPDDDWVLLDAKCRRICAGDRPQALIEIAPIAPTSIPLVRQCRTCQELVH